MHTVNFLIHLVGSHQILAYLLLYVGLLFEGEFFLISTGILTHLGALNFWVSLPFLLLGGFSKTIFGYEFGGFLFKKFGHHKFFKFIQKRVYNVLPRFKTRPFWSIFISKFIMGANNAVIIFSGYEKIDYKRFLEAEITSTLIWIPFLLSIGYFFSYTALHISREIWKFFAVVLILFIMFIIFDKFISWLYELFEEYHGENQ